MDTVPAGAVRRSEGGEVPMELTLVRATNRRFQMWIPLLLAFGFVLVAAVPLAAGGRRPTCRRLDARKPHPGVSGRQRDLLDLDHSPQGKGAKPHRSGIQSRRLRGRVVRSPGFLSADTTHLGMRPG